MFWFLKNKQWPTSPSTYLGITVVRMYNEWTMNVCDCQKLNKYLFFKNVFKRDFLSVYFYQWFNRKHMLSIYVSEILFTWGVNKSKTLFHALNLQIIRQRRISVNYEDKKSLRKLFFSQNHKLALCEFQRVRERGKKKERERERKRGKKKERERKKEWERRKRERFLCGSLILLIP